MTHRLLLIISILRKHHYCLLAPVFVGVRQGNGVGDSAVKVPVFAQHNPLVAPGRAQLARRMGQPRLWKSLGYIYSALPVRALVTTTHKVVFARS